MFWSYLCGILLTIVSVLLMFIILLQRGRGGGLAGALGGMGGQSAFGTKAGDVFTKITIGMALVWVVLAGVTGMVMFHDSERRSREFAKQSSEVSAAADTAEAGGLIVPPGNGEPLEDGAAAGDDTPSSDDDKPDGTDGTPSDDSDEKKSAEATDSE